MIVRPHEKWFRMLVAFDAIVQEIRDPFGKDPNDLALDWICDNIEYSLAEIGGLPLPTQSDAVDGYYVT